MKSTKQMCFISSIITDISASSIWELEGLDI